MIKGAKWCASWIILVLPLTSFADGTVGNAESAGVAEPPRPTLRARWTEDWSVLRDAAPLSDSVSRPWRRIKYIPINDSGSSYLSFGGETRLAHERYDDADAGVSDTGRQDAALLRAALFGDLRLSQQWRVFSELGYATAHDREGGPSAVDETDPDLWQLFIDYGLTFDNGERLVVRLGRQLIETANVFITAGEANNIRLSYDGIRIAIPRHTETKFDAFFAEYVDYSDGTFDMSGTGEYFWGLKAGRRLTAAGLDVNALYLGWDLKDRQFEQGGAERHDEERHTLMLWMNRPLTEERRWGVDYYFAYQFGEYEGSTDDSDIKAFAAFGSFQYALSYANSPVILGLKTSYFSGDDDPEDDELNTFYNHVFGTPYFGWARDIMPFNLIHVQPNVSFRLGPVGITLSHEFLWRADTDDAYYNSPNAITIRADESGSAWLGQQTQLAFRLSPRPGIILSAYLAEWFVGDAIDEAGGNDRTYSYIGLNYLF